MLYCRSKGIWTAKLLNSKISILHPIVRGNLSPQSDQSEVLSLAAMLRVAVYYFMVEAPDK